MPPHQIVKGNYKRRKISSYSVFHVITIKYAIKSHILNELNEKLMQQDDGETCIFHTLLVYDCGPVSSAQIWEPFLASFSQMIHVTAEVHRLLNSCMSF